MSCLERNRALSRGRSTAADPCGVSTNPSTCVERCDKPLAVHSVRAIPWVAVLCALAAELSSCALSKPPEHEQVVADALPTGTTIPPRWTEVVNAEDVSDDWLSTFNDPGLDAVVAEAIRNNLDLRQAVASVEVARQTAVVVGAKLMPQVGASLGVGTTRDENHGSWFHSTRAMLGVSWEPDIWGRVRAQRDAAEASYQATALDFAYARQSLAATAATSWYLNVETRQLLAIAQETVAIYSNLLELVEIRRDSGRVTDLDVAEASANLNAAESDLRAAQGLFAETRRSLELLLGRYPSAELTVAESFAVLPPPVRAGLPSTLLERRPDIVAAERFVLAAFRSQESAKLALLPSFFLNLDAGRLGDPLLSVLHLNPWMANAGLGMSIPIYQGGALDAKVEIATAQQQQAVAAYGSAVLVAFREVENGLMNESLFEQRLEFDQKVLRDRTEAVRIARVKYEAGAIDLLYLLQLQAAEIASRVQVIKLRNAQLANRIGLHLALGGGFDAEPATAAANTP